MVGPTQRPGYLIPPPTGSPREGNWRSTSGEPGCVAACAEVLWREESVVTAVAYAVPGDRARLVRVNSRHVERDPGLFVRGMERWRAELGLSSNAFADFLGVSRGYWSRLRRGLTPLTMSLVNRVLTERPELAYALPADAARGATPST